MLRINYDDFTYHKYILYIIHFFWKCISIILLTQLTPARPLRSENGRQSRPTSGQFKLPGLSAVPVHTYSMIVDDESPPPLPEKQAHADYMNLSSGEDDEAPQRQNTVTKRIRSKVRWNNKSDSPFSSSQNIIVCKNEYFATTMQYIYNSMSGCKYPYLC